MKKIFLVVLLFVGQLVFGQSNDQQKRLDSLVNHTLVVAGDVFTADKCGDLYILHAESSKLVVFTGTAGDVLSLLFWIEEYPCDDMFNSWFYYQELVKEKIYE